MSHQCTCLLAHKTLLLLTISHLALWVSAKTGPAHNKVVVCYISSWAVYRPGQGAYSIDNFDPNLCTHAVYAFAGLDSTQSAIKSLDPSNDLRENNGKGGYRKLTALKNSHPHLKVSLSIGGWNEGSKNYSALAADPSQRSRFVRQATDFIRKYNFDGLDLHWKYPTQRGGESSDRENFVQLAKELRTEFDKQGLLLTSAVSGVKYIIDQAYDIAQLSQHLHFLHVLCFDYHGSWEQKIGYNSPLVAAAGDVQSVQYIIDYLMELGAPKEKIILGLPFYGRTFQSKNMNVGDGTNGSDFAGPYTREGGFFGYNEICYLVNNKSSGWTTVWDQQASQMLARGERDYFSGLVQIITYDSARSIANKVRFAMLKNLAGVMAWTVDTDDFLGACEPENMPFSDYKPANYPLLRTVNEAIILTLDDINRKGDVK